MKTLLTTFILTAFLSVNAFSQSNVNKQREQGISINKSDLNSTSKMSQDDTEHSVWYNYARTMANIYGASIRIIDVAVFPDTIRRSFGGTYQNLRGHYFLNLLDPASTQFATRATLDFITEIYVRDENTYVWDSVASSFEYLNPSNFYNSYQNTFSTDTAYDTVYTTSGADSLIINKKVITNRYTIDTIKTAIVDTALLEFMDNNDAGNMVPTFYDFSNDAANSSGYNADTVRYMDIGYDYLSNRLVAQNKTQIKIPMDSAFRADSLVTVGSRSNVYNFQFEVNRNINANGLIAMGLTFVPGYDNYNKKYTIASSFVGDTTETARDSINEESGDRDTITVDSTFVLNFYDTVVASNTRDTVAKYNHLQLEIYEEQGSNTYPLYFDGEYNNTYFMPNDVRYNNSGNFFGKNFNGKLVPRYAIEDGNNYENMDVFYHLTCSSCFTVDVKERALKAQTVTVYPNPVASGEMLNVDFFNAYNNKSIQLIIRDLQGKTVVEKTLNIVNGKNRVEIPSSFLSTGLYMIELANKNQRLTQKVLVK